jgi:hypothetical protein
MNFTLTMLLNLLQTFALILLWLALRNMQKAERSYLESLQYYEEAKASYEHLIKKQEEQTKE